jgi:small-conductance mechanosensitive channel
MTEVFEPGRVLLQQLVGLAPRAGLTLAVIALGLALSAAARRSTRWLVRRTGLEALVERLGVSRLLYSVGYKGSFADAVAAVVGGTGLLITFSMVAELLGLPGVAEGIGVVVELLPRLVTATMVLLGGLFAADLLKGLVSRVARRRDDLDSPDLVARGVYYGVVAVSCTLAADHLGLETDLVNALIQITAAAALFSAGLAFALGSRGTFENIVARHYAQRMFRVGDHLRVVEVQGTLVRIGPISAWLRTESGESVAIPCSTLVSSAVRVTLHLPASESPPV